MIILIGLPGSFACALRLIVGINLLFGGASIIAMARQRRPNKKAPTGGTVGANCASFEEG